MTGPADTAVPPPPRRTPAFAASVAVVLAIGVGAGVPVLSILYGAFRRTEAYVDPLLDVEPEPGWITAWTPRHATLRAAQDEELTVLLQVVLALTALLMVIALVNLVTLLLVRSPGRRAELAVRTAVGGTPARLATQLLREAAAVAAGGLVVAAAVAGAVLSFMKESWPGSPELWGPPAPAMVPAGVAAVFVAALLAAWLAPLSSLFGRNLRRYLAGNGRTTSGRGEVWLRNGLVVAQLAALLVLLTGAALLLLTVVPGSGRDGGPGLDPDATLTLQVEAPGSPRDRTAFYRDALERVAGVRGVRGASFGTAGTWVGLGPSDRVWSRCSACWDGGMFKPASVAVSTFHAVTPGAFRALGTPLVAGREFTDADTGQVVVLSSALALALFPRGTAIGQQVQLGGDGPLRAGGRWYTVIGIVRQIRARGIGVGGAPGLGLYLPALRHPPARMGLAVRTSGDPMRHLPEVAGAVARAGGVVGRPATMERYLASFAAPIRWFAILFAGLAAGAVVLGAGGLYGVMRYNVARRTREIGIRMAIGADTRQVGRMVLGQSLRIVAAGMVAGLFGALPLAQALQSLVRGVRPFDPRLYAVIAATLAAIALAAALRPARHATRLDPHAALREE